MDEPIKRDGSRLVWQPPEGEAVVGLCLFQGRMMVATGRGVYEFTKAPDSDDYTVKLVA